jgi:hypothetical protein
MQQNAYPSNFQVRFSRNPKIEKIAWALRSNFIRKPFVLFFMISLLDNLMLT